MRPKGKLLTLIVLFAAVGVITATGAFTTVEAERTATVDVAGDNSALLGLSPAEDLEYGEMVTGADEGQISLDFSASVFDDADGLNPNANTTFDPVINIANNGDQDVTITIEMEVDGSVEGFYFIDGNGNTIGDGGEISLDTGNAQDLGIMIETGSDPGDDFSVDITFTANADNQ